MSIKIAITGKLKSSVTLQTPLSSGVRQIKHVKVTNRGSLALGWNQLYGTLIAQGKHEGKTDNDALMWAQQVLHALSEIDSVHPTAITQDDLKYMLANPSMGNVILADNLDVELILKNLDARGQDLGDPYSPTDEPDPFYVETFFTEATQAILQGHYQGWWSLVEREPLPIGAPGGPGKVMHIGAQSVADEEAFIEGNWVDSGIGSGHRLIYLGQDRILDWVPSAPGVKSSYRVWNYDRFASWSDPLTEVLLEGNWSTISMGHELIWLGRDLRGNPNSVDDLVLDWVPSTLSEDHPAGYYRVFRVNPEGTKYKSTASDILAEPYLVKGVWSSIASSKKLIYLGGDRVLDWEPSSGNARIWVLLDREKIKNATENFDPLSESPEAEWDWGSVREGQRILNLGGDRVLTWEPATGWYRVWAYDRTVMGKDNPFSNQPLIAGYWDDIDETHELVWLGGRQVLDWVPESSEYRIRLFDRTVVSANPLK